MSSVMQCSKMFKVVRLSPDSKLPHRSSETSPGLDVYASEACTLPTNTWCDVDIGISVIAPSDCYVRVAPVAFSLQHGVSVLGGVVSSVENKPIQVFLFNHGPSAIKICKGDCIAQLLFEKVYPGVTLHEVFETPIQPL